MSSYADADGIDGLARTLSAAAERVREQARGVRSSTASMRWRGRAADAFHASVVREAGALDRAAGELDDAAAALRRHADAVRAEISRLIAAEHLLSRGWSAVAGLAR